MKPFVASLATTALLCFAVVIKADDADGYADHCGKYARPEKFFLCFHSDDGVAKPAGNGAGNFRALYKEGSLTGKSGN